MELFGFAEPKARLITWRSSFLHPLSSHKKLVHTHWFNHKVEVFCPFPYEGSDNSQEVRQRLLSSLSRPDGGLPFFYVVRCQLSALIEPHFIERNMQHAEFYALSIGVHVDHHNVCAIVPSGGAGTATLFLSVDKDTYEQLGITGEKSAFSNSHKFNIKINLTAPHFRPGKKQYERVKWCLTNRLSNVELLVCKCAGGRTEHIDFPPEIDKKQLNLKESFEELRNIRIPTLLQSHLETVSATEKMNDMQISDNNSIAANIGEEQSKAVKIGELTNRSETAKKKKRKNKLDDDSRAYLNEVFDWMGFMSNRIMSVLSSAGTEDSSLSSFSFTQLDCQDHAKGYSFTWQGFIAPFQVMECIERARQVMREGKLPWAAVSVWGFEDAPLSWGKHEHGFLQGGENDYTFIMFPDESYWLFLAPGTHDTFS